MTADSLAIWLTVLLLMPSATATQIPFELSSGFLRTEDLQPASFELVRYAANERKFGADNGEVRAQLFSKIGERDGIGNIDRKAFGLARDAAIAWSAPDFRDGWALGELPDEGMLAAAAADDENPHFAVTIFVAEPVVNFGFGAAWKAALHPTPLVKTAWA